MTTTPPTNSALPPAGIASVANAILDFFIGDLMRNKAVNKVLGYLTVASGLVFHQSLGATVAGIAVAAGATVVGAHSLTE